MSVLEVGVLGDVQAALDGVLIDIPPGARSAVLAALALAAPRSVSREHLVAVVWDEDPPPTAVNALQVHISALRKALGKDAIVTVGDGYRLADGVALDVQQFDGEVQRGRSELASGRPESAASFLRQALARWRGPALCDIAETALARAEATRLHEARLAAVELRVRADLECGRASQLVPELETLVQEHPYDESLVGLLMQALYRCGRQADALAAYESARTLLADELGLDPGTELRDLHRRVLDQTEPMPATSGAARLESPLPALLDATIGREAELSALVDLVQEPDVRLVTLVGPGGVGKTRLSIELAHRITRLHDTVAFVPLAESTRSDDVATALCAALGLLVTDDPETTLLGALAARECVLVCDNFEHVVEAAPLLLRLLSAAPDLRLLVTSRRLLGVRGERPFPVSPLGSVDTGSSTAADLLLTRVREADPTFQATPADREDAEAIAGRCDGLPLALELAASRTRVLSLAELRATLSEPLALAAVGAHDRPDRHQTMRSNIAWSVEGLDPEQARLLAALTVFRGGFTATTASSVAGMPLDEVVSHLADLCDRSLVQRSASLSGQRRFDLLVVVRDFVAERLTPEELAALRVRHSECFRDWLSPPPDPGVLSLSVERWLERLTERPNVREAIRFAMQEKDSALTGDLVIAAAATWWQAESRPELDEWLETLLADSGTSPQRRCDALVWRSLRWGDVDPALQHEPLNEALALATELGDERRRAFALWQFMTLSYRGFEQDFGQRCADEAYAIASRLPDAQVLVSALLSGMGILGFERDPEGALEHMSRSVQIAREHGFDLRLMISLNNLAELHMILGDPEAAHACATEGIELALRAQSPYGLADHRGQRGTANLLLGRPDEAAVDLHEAVRGLWQLGQNFYALHSLERLAAAHARTRPDLAALAVAIVDASAEFVSEALSQELRDSYLGTLADQLGSERYDELTAHGRTLTQQQGTAAAIRAFLDIASGPAGR